jgi:hypothetical protein
MSTEEKSWLVHQRSLPILAEETSGSKQKKLANGIRLYPWKSYQQRHLVARRRNWRKEWEFSLAKYFCSHFPSDFLHAVKSYDMGREGLLCIFTALKKSSPRLGFNPRTLVPMASTLTTTLPRRLPKRRYLPKSLHSVTTQKNIIFTTVRTSNFFCVLASMKLFEWTYHMKSVAWNSFPLYTTCLGVQDRVTQSNRKMTFLCILLPLRRNISCQFLNRRISWTQLNTHNTHLLRRHINNYFADV